MNMFKKFLLSFKKEFEKDDIVITMFIFAISFFQWLMLDLSSYIAFDTDKLLLYGLIGVFTMFLINIIFIILLRKTKVAIISTSFLTLVLSLVNHLVYSCRGIPFVLSDIYNMKTALNVINGTTLIGFILRPRYLLLVFLFIVQMSLIILPIKGHSFKTKYKFKLLLLVGVFVLFYHAPFNALSIPDDAIRHSFKDGIAKYGYLTCLIKQAVLDVNPISPSKNYNENRTLQNILENSKTTVFSSGDYPDIILIINEAFYDLNQLYSLKGTNYLKHFYSLDNAIYGYCVVPGIRGGTNLTEYEILTGNAMLPFSNITPFNTLKFDNSNSFLFHLKNLGYNTISLHPKDKTNYNRFYVYPKIGFDKSFYEEDFKNIEYWNKRKEACLDSSLYSNMINWYNEMDDSPRFIYALTIQNHWPYNQIDDEELISNYENDFDNYNHEVNEYLSSISISDEAFGKLIDYYSKSNRNVIICMLGDHAPYLKESYDYVDDDDYNLKQMSTPFVIWSNNSALINKQFEANVMNETRLSAIYMIPTILESAKVPLSNYQNYLINMRNKIPVFTSFGTFYDNNGAKHNFTKSQDSSKNDEIELYDILCDYIDIEYLNITKPELTKTFCK